MNQGNIKIAGLASEAVFGDGSLDGDAVFAPVFPGPPAKVTLPSTKCATLPPLFAIYGILSTYSPLPYIGLSTFTGTPNAPASLSASGAGYAFFAPTNLSKSRTKAAALEEQSLITELCATTSSQPQDFRDFGQFFGDTVRRRERHLVP